MKSDFDTGGERASERHDVEVLVFCKFEDERSRLEPTSRLKRSAPLENELNYLCLLDDRVDDDCRQV